MLIFQNFISLPGTRRVLELNSTDLSAWHLPLRLLYNNGRGTSRVSAHTHACMQCRETYTTCDRHVRGGSRAAGTKGRGVQLVSRLATNDQVTMTSLRCFPQSAVCTATLAACFPAA